MRYGASRGVIAAAMLLATTACGGDNGSSSAAGAGGTTTTAGTSVAVTPTPSPTSSATPAPSSTPTPAAASPTPSPTPAATQATTASSWATASALYATQPDVANCRAGTLAASVRADMLAAVNAIRTLHKLPAVTYAQNDEAQVQQTALMMAANGQLSHTPDSSWKCYTAAGAAGAGSSDLYGGTVSPYLVWSNEADFVAGWMTEVNNIVANNVGHRRWILDPFLTQVAYGRVAQVLSGGSRTDAGALKVFNFSAASPAPSGLPGFVAYPYGDYPAKWFDTRALLSFSVIADAASKWNNNQVDFSKATVTVKAGSTALSVSNVSYDTSGYGLPNNIQWQVAGLTAGTSYTVTIAGVVVKGATQSYTYTFRIV